MKNRFKFRIIVNTDVKTINGTFKGQYIYYCNGFIQTKFKTYFFGNNKRYVFLNSRIKTINQCTGLKDKNGKQVFFDDLVKWDDDIYIVQKQTDSRNYGRVVLFPIRLLGKDKKYTENCELIPDCIKESEVIGNIYENPELLKGEQ